MVPALAEQLGHLSKAAATSLLLRMPSYDAVTGERRRSDPSSALARLRPDITGGLDALIAEATRLRVMFTASKR